jgi:hypothetical protein
MGSWTTWLVALAAFGAGVFWWWLFEYVLHRWAFHEMRGKGIGSREHLEHHVKASWSYDHLLGLVWFGILLTGFGWGVLAAWLVNPAVGWGFGLGWAIAYYFYEWEHRAAHLRPPATSWHRWLRKHHFHHHFGHPMRNHGVSIPLWDIVFGTLDRPERVKVPRRLAMPWLLDEHGEVLPEFAADYELVGSAHTDLRQEQIDRARAFANLTPTS